MLTTRYRRAESLKERSRTGAKPCYVDATETAFAGRQCICMAEAFAVAWCTLAHCLTGLSDNIQGNCALSSGQSRLQRHLATKHTLHAPSTRRAEPAWWPLVAGTIVITVK